MSHVKDSLQQVLEEIRQVEVEAGRAKGTVDLIAVSKTFEGPDIRPALEAGHRQFGENRVQEAKGKWPALKEDFPDTVLHLIGPLQSNKTKEAVALFDVIHTVDREKIAKTIAAEMAEQQKKLALYVQVNTGEESQKAGIFPKLTEEFVSFCRQELALPIVGLMCIPPAEEEPALHFSLLRNLANKLDLPRLSMGMSGDFQKAIKFGATDVRVGSAIFGARDYPA